MTDTIELTPVDTVRVTATLRGDDLPPGEHRLHTGRCVVELAMCVLGPLARRWSRVFLAAEFVR